MDQMKIGAFLKALRKEKDLTQEQLAEQFNTSRRSVSRWETGSNLPDIDVLIGLADFYELDLRELLDGARRNEQMNNEVNETALKVADYQVEKNMQNAKLAIGFFIVGIVGCIFNEVLRFVDIGHSFFSGLVTGIAAGIGPAAMLFGLMYAADNMKKLKKEKERILDK